MNRFPDIDPEDPAVMHQIVSALLELPGWWTLPDLSRAVAARLRVKDLPGLLAAWTVLRADGVLNQSGDTDYVIVRPALIRGWIGERSSGPGEHDVPGCS